MVPQPPGPDFHLAFEGFKLERRQSGGYAFLSPNGYSSMCNAATPFQISGYNLYADGVEIGLTSTQQSTGYAPLLGSSGPLDQEYFYFNDTGNLVWYSPNFTTSNSEASFCYSSDGIIFAVFTSDLPYDCQQTVLSALPGMQSKNVPTNSVS